MHKLLTFVNIDLKKSNFLSLVYLIFVNNRYYTKGSSYSDKAIIESKEFQKFKSQFDIEGMKASIEKVENHYLNIFFKMFWTDSRKARLSDALKEAYGTLQKNIELRDELLMQALSEGIV